MGAMSMPMAAANMPGMVMGGYAAPAVAAPAAVGSQYTCPMHPGVVSSGPGTCPYCQMALQRK
jgi:hypothetical protein